MLREQQFPRFDARIETVGNDDWYRRALRLDGPVDITRRVDVDMLDGGLQFARVDGVDRDKPAPVMSAYRPTPPLTQ
jgi:hypothetical protein